MFTSASPFSRNMSKKNMISTHILDTVNGGAASGVNVSLYKLASAEKWELIKDGKTDGEGRCASFVTEDKYTEGIYKFVFEVGEYFKLRGQKTIFPTIDVRSLCYQNIFFYLIIIIIHPMCLFN